MTYRAQERRFRNSPLMWMVVPLAALLAAVIGVGATLLAAEGREAVADKEAVGREAVAQAVTIEELCSSADEVATALEDAGQCEQARVVQEEAERVGAVPPQAAPTPPNPDELMGYVRAAVVDYCGGTDRCRPDTAVLVGIVGDFLAKNPPKPGRAPTPEEVADAARAVLVAEPDMFRGLPGETGAPGPGPTDDQVLAQVAVFCAEERCRGARGDQGAQGPGISGFYFARNEAGQCEAVVTFVNPASGEERTERRAAGDAACEPAAPAPEPSPAPIPE